ncbi:MAG: hydroxymethylbilane synthase [Bacteroidetes bacterium]|jgi:hydroxymethylbilane synthase|nr:hydroxymethylbilane synthase [Bacteroidota bacterium]
MMASSLTLGTRGSKLALWQAHHVQHALQAAGHAVAIKEISTKGDRILDTPLAEIGDKGLFTKELDVALLNGEIQLAVHSLKDLPTQLPPGIALAAVGKRAHPGDALVAHPSFEGKLEDLPEGAVLATSSLRRRAQLLAWRPDLTIVPVRGNVPTRIAKLDASDWHGVVLAVAGLERLELTDRIRTIIPYDMVLPAVGQGALGIVCAENAAATRALLRQTLHDEATSAAVLSERALLRRLEGGCQVPIGARGRLEDGMLHLDACVAALDGSRLLRSADHAALDRAEALGTALAERLLAQGADAILQGIRATDQ